MIMWSSLLDSGMELHVVKDGEVLENVVLVDTDRRVAYYHPRIDGKCRDVHVAENVQVIGTREMTPYVTSWVASREKVVGKVPTAEDFERLRHVMVSEFLDHARKKILSTQIPHLIEGDVISLRYEAYFDEQAVRACAKRVGVTLQKVEKEES